MAKYRNLKKVSWAPDGNLCQIRQFSSEECPSKVGLQVDENLHFQRPQRQQLNIDSNDLPPGFSRSSMKKSEKLVHIPVRRWKRPPKVNLDPSWVVAISEQSEEVYLQRQRELTVFEAVYPRLTDIPHSPSGALCKDGHVPDDRTTPAIRITPIEDDETSLDSASEACPKLPVVSVSLPQGFPNTNQPVNPPQAQGTQSIISSGDTVVDAAASAALDAFMKSNEIGSTVDTRILFDILNNPEAVSMLLNRPASASRIPHPKTASEQVPTSVTFSSPSTDVFSSPSVSGNWGIAQNTTHCPSTSMQSGYAAETILSAKAVTLPLGNFGGLVSAPSPMPSFGAPPQVTKTYEVLPRTLPVSEIKPFFGTPPPPQVKDVNYYKNLIKQHGMDNNKDLQGKVAQQQKGHELSKNGQRFSKNSKPCTFFNTPKGCRRGLECSFRHDMTELPNAKRLKLINQSI